MLVQSIPYPAGGGDPPSDVTAAVEGFVTGTATGAQPFTSADISGVTPAVALVLQPNHDPTNDPNETPILSFGLAAIQGTTDLSAYSWSRDNNASTSVFSAAHAKGHNVFNNSGSTVKQADGQTISGGIELNYTTNTAPSLSGAFVAIAGTDVSAKIGEINLGTGTTALDQTGPAFEPNAVLLFGNGFQFNGSAGTPFFYTVGVAVNDGSDTQRCVMWAETGSLADSRPFQTLRTDCAGGRISDANGSLTYKVTVSDFDASGFSVTPSANASSNRIAYVALKCQQAALVDWDTPTTLGSHSIIGAGFTPKGAILIGTSLEAVNSHPGSTSDLQSALSICVVGTDGSVRGMSGRINSGEATTDCASQLAAALIGGSATDCDALFANFVQWTADGMDIDVDATHAAAKKWIVLFYR